jgi:hypothetical protein
MSRFSCNTCRFGQNLMPADKPEANAIECRFDTPKVLVVNDVVETHWPEVRGDHWCGKHEISEEARKAGLAARDGA